MWVGAWRRTIPDDPMFLLLALLLLLVLPDPWNVVAALAALVAGGLEVLYFYRRMRREKVVTGVENLVGAVGKAVEALEPEGHVRVHGELWEARSPTPIDPGARVEVVAVENLTLEVRPAEGAAAVKAAGSTTLLIVALLALAGCGGDDESASETYANGVCSSLSTWVTDVQSTAQSLGDEGLSIEEEDLRTAVGDVRDATETLVDDLEGLGPPETEAGNEARTELNELGSELTQQVETVEEALDSGGELTAIAATVTTALSTAATAVETTFEELQGLDPGGELEDAFRNSDDCESLSDELENIGS